MKDFKEEGYSNIKIEKNRKWSVIEFITKLKVDFYFLKSLIITNFQYFRLIRDITHSGILDLLLLLLFTYVISIH